MVVNPVCRNEGVGTSPVNTSLGGGEEAEERVRLVVLGGPGVGKSCIVKRFLSNTYSDRYRSTVEDLYSREFDLGTVTLKVDILDTAGDQQFPAMRRLSIATASAFLLVYATSSATSFDAVRRCVEEIREQRSDYQEVPIVVAGNKSDLAKTHREVAIEDVSEWLYCELPRMRAKVLECSARDDTGIKDIFKTLLFLGRPSTNADGGLKRRSSAYVNNNKSKSRSASGGSTTEACSTEINVPKPRSRSLIRRTSRKTKQAAANAAPDDCRQM